ncbi:HIRAN domain-containing protein [Tepidimonas charontis]|uniref:HIRAN domain protein n=1 Tax=Tepidimonas charontis TaxID=2267262 RepID=A0A554XHB8_9BURK|nr:HIRAN domain-containing protein [Tepidimonas charontis]TSE35230.1 HIRAN domain protein [Tepidimonas charontis]
MHAAAAAREAAVAAAPFDPVADYDVRQPALPALDATSRARLIPVLSCLGLEPAAPGTLLIANVAGYAHYDGPQLEAQGQAGFASGDALTLEREPDNPRDPLAVRILWQGAHLGHVPRAESAEIARRLDRGEPLVCRLLRYTPAAAAWRKIEFVIAEGK